MMTNKGIISTIMVVILAIAAVSYSATTTNATLPLPLQRFLTVKFQPITTVDGLPKNIQSALFGRMKHDPRLANPGERFNATDVVNPKHPMRRLVVAGGSSTSWFICYEHGGRGYHRQFVIFKTDTGTPKIEFTGRFTADVRSYNELKEAVQRNLIPDETVEAEKYGYY